MAIIASRKRALLVSLAVLAMASSLLTCFVLAPNFFSTTTGLTTGTNTETAPTASAHFVGSTTCEACHQQQTQEWLASDHHRAMEHANEKTVLGNFNNSVFNYFGHTTRFSKKGEQFLVSTENQQGKTETFVVAYTLGYKPLQQYLVNFPDGRIQVLPFAWDTRSKAKGGQRWFHLYPDDKVAPGNPLFWTRPLQNWNHMCADCHTTDFAKNFSDNKNSFASHWQEIGNGCESCHGPGSEHVRLMEKNKFTPAPDHYLINKLATQTAQMDQCGVCHARRTRLRENPGDEKMLQTWQPELLQEGLYFNDGQMHDEVFNMGSFMQSKMHGAGVSCTNCHNPHSTKLKIDGNGLCTQCHAQGKYDTENHHFHVQGSEGALCVNCHMPTQTYMVVDVRHDHRFSLPRPDLSEEVGAPNTCVGCHAGKLGQKDKNNKWAAKVISKHFGTTRPEHFAHTFWSARHQQLDAAAGLKKFILDEKTAPIVSATALMEMGNYLDPAGLQVISEKLKSTDALIRLGALQGLNAAPPQQRTPLLLGLLDDPSRAVRLALAPMLVGLDKKELSSKQQEQEEKLFAEYKSWLEADSDRASALVSLAGFYLAQGDSAGAQALFEKALQRDETSLSAYLNYADYYRSMNNDGKAGKLLRKALQIYPDSADAHYALALLLVRANQRDEALRELDKARRLAPANSQYAYVYGIGLYASGQQQKALQELEKAHDKFPSNLQILSALVSYYSERGDMARAQDFGAQLQELAPH